MMKPIIGISMGDPAGVGPEVCLKAATNPKVRDICTPFIYGDRFSIQKSNEACGLDLEITSVEDVSQAQHHKVTVVSVGEALASQNVDGVSAGVVNALTGQLSFDAVTRAIEDALAGKIAAVVTAPIHKEAWHAARIKYPGHTELFARRAKTDRFCMMMTSPTISCSLVTCHVGYHEVPGLLSIERILEVIQLTHAALKRMRGREPVLVAMGLNPHAGENGLFGQREEQEIIQPAIERAREQGITISDPVPPDTAFLPWKLKQTDGHICMYPVSYTHLTLPTTPYV